MIMLLSNNNILFPITGNNISGGHTTLFLAPVHTHFTCAQPHIHFSLHLCPNHTHTYTPVIEWTKCLLPAPHGWWARSKPRGWSTKQRGKPSLTLLPHQRAFKTIQNARGGLFCSRNCSAILKIKSKDIKFHQPGPMGTRVRIGAMLVIPALGFYCQFVCFFLLTWNLQWIWRSCLVWKTWPIFQMQPKDLH